jgi:hypothetical protein
MREGGAAGASQLHEALDNIEPERRAKQCSASRNNPD